jgi:SAM-dependent MidA family methyltransferase
MSLARRLMDRAHREGPLTFAAFMEAALYDEREGFYARPPVGEEGHFVTSPHVSEAFGALIGRQVAQVWDLLRRPDPLDVVELGAGDGTLGQQVLNATRVVPELHAAVRYIAVERSAGARSALRRAGLQAHGGLSDVAPVTGLILANELLDNLPFHRLRRREGPIVEVMVTTDDGRLVETEAEPTPEALAALRSELPEGQERPVSPAALNLVREIAASLSRGYCILFDYGFAAGETPGPVHAYRRHRVSPDVLIDPGTRDVTAAVDLEAVAAEARQAGLQVWGPISQREALLGLGFRSWIQGIRTRQTEAHLAGSWREANRLFGQRSRATILIEPEKLGGLRVLVLGTEGLPPPAAAIGDRESGC